MAALRTELTYLEGGPQWWCGQAHVQLTTPDIAVLRGFRRGGRDLMAVSALWVPRTCRGQGRGNTLMAAVTRWADAQSVDLWLYAQPYGDHPRLLKHELEAWYERWGFTRVARRSPDLEMLRRAQDSNT